jgi:dihydroflavonol-4-reductase
MTLEGRTVLVTGASGFVGGALANRLLGDGAEVRALVRDASRARELAARGAELVTGDLTDPNALRRAVEGCAVVFNVGAALHGSAAWQYAVNVAGVSALVAAARQAGVGRLVQVSSVAVYGYDRPGIMTEAMPPRPGVEYYAQSKALGERVLFTEGTAPGLEVTAIRPGMIYGPRSRTWTGKMFQLVRRPPAPLPGQGNTYCPLVYIDDVVDLLLTVAEHPAAPGEVFNAVTDEPVTWREYLGAYAAMAGHQTFLPIPLALLRTGAALAEPLLRLFGEPEPAREAVEAFVARRRAYSMNKAARLLGWRPAVNLVEGMAGAEAWLRETGQVR